ncbi:MAG: hypothetical protein JSR91_00430 [Proteobacteria bacterium]|nr:hypothetical protein [Pseudomonadota bacterium]
MTQPISITPAMLAAAWNVVEKYWPKKIIRDARGIGRLVHCGPWLEPKPCPAFKEAFIAGLKAGGFEVDE